MTTLVCLWAFYLCLFVIDNGYIRPWRYFKGLRNGTAPDLKRSWLSGALLFGFPIFSVILFIRVFFIDIYAIPTSSMEPAFQIGDKVIGYKAGIKKIPPKRGEVIVFKYPREPDTLYIKRVWGVGGDYVRIRNGTIYINNVETASRIDQIGGQRIDINGHEFTLNGDDPASIWNEMSIKVPENGYFVLGDNLIESKDSREWGMVYDYHLVARVP